MSVKFFAAAAAGTLALASAAPASAANAAPVSNVFDFAAKGVTAMTVNGMDVSTTGWTMSDLTSVTPIMAGVYAYQGAGYGLGVSYLNEGDSGSKINQHTVDNVDAYDFVALYFSAPVKLTAMTLNAFKVSSNQAAADKDDWVSYATFTGAVPTTAAGVQTAMNGLFPTLLTNGKSGADGALSSDLSGKVGNVWVIGAARSATERNDGFKIASVTVAPVPEPATWAAMVLGFGLAGAGLRRRRSSARVVFA